jgi:hypothetical protein
MARHRGRQAQPPPVSPFPVLPSVAQSFVFVTDRRFKPIMFDPAAMLVVPLATCTVAPLQMQRVRSTWQLAPAPITRVQPLSQDATHCVQHPRPTRGPAAGMHVPMASGGTLDQSRANVPSPAFKWRGAQIARRASLLIRWQARKVGKTGSDNPIAAPLFGTDAVSNQAVIGDDRVGQAGLREPANFARRRAEAH